MTRNFVFQASNFKFPKPNMAFINAYVGSNFGTQAGPIIGEFREWLARLSYGDESQIYYDARYNEEDGGIVKLMETAYVSSNDCDVINMTFYRELKESHDMSIFPTDDSDEALKASKAALVAHLDGCIERANLAQQRTNRGIYHSLRPLLVNAIGKAHYATAMPEVNPFDFQIIFEEGDHLYFLEFHFLAAVEDQKG